MLDPAADLPPELLIRVARLKIDYPNGKVQVYDGRLTFVSEDERGVLEVELETMKSSFSPRPPYMRLSSLQKVTIGQKT